MSPTPTTIDREAADQFTLTIGMRASTLHLQLNGRRPMPAEVAAEIRRALPEIQDHE